MKAALSFSILLLLGFAGFAEAGQSPAPAGTADGVFGEKIDVRAVDVEVVVTDAQGHRVGGLKAEDFRLLVDGREERIDYFAEVQEGQTRPPAAPKAVGETAAAVPSSASPPSPAGVAGGGRVGTSYLVFLDDAFTLPSQRNAALSTLERDLSLLGLGDRMAIVAYDGHGLTVLAKWTADAKALRAAFQAAARRKTHGADIIAERRSAQRADTIDVQDLNENADLLGVNPLGDLWQAEHHFGSVGRTVVAAADALRGMPLPEGRRVMMVLAGGWPWDGDPRTLKPLTTAANLLGYTLYPVYVAGFDPLVEAADAEIDSVWTSIDSRDISSAPVVNGWQRSSQAALRSLALATGGVAALNRDHALRQVVEDTRSYYWLGFSPIWKADDRPHDIRMEVRRPGLTARSRSRFFDFSHATNAALTAESVLSLGGDPVQRRLAVTAEAPRRSDRQTIELPVTLSIPAEILNRQPGPAGGYRLEGNLSVATLDAAGGRASLAEQTVRGVLSEAPRPGVFVRVRSVLRLRRAPQRLVFTVTGAAESPIWTDLEVKP
jgi:VWFA-related protein